MRIRSAAEDDRRKTSFMYDLNETRMRPVTVRYSNVRCGQEAFAIEAMFGNELFGLPKPVRSWIQLRPPTFQLNATFLRHKVDDVQAALLPFLLVPVGFGIEHM